MPVDPLSWRPQLRIHELRPANDSLVGFYSRYCFDSVNSSALWR